MLLFSTSLKLATFSFHQKDSSHQVSTYNLMILFCLYWMYFFYDGFTFMKAMIVVLFMIVIQHFNLNTLNFFEWVLFGEKTMQKTMEVVCGFDKSSENHRNATMLTGLYPLEAKASLLSLLWHQKCLQMIPNVPLRQNCYGWKITDYSNKVSE